MTEFKREDRYIVFKRSDLKAMADAGLLPDEEARALNLLRARVMFWRTENKKKAPLRCVVVESDWPEYEPTWKAIEARCSSGSAGDKS